MPSTSSGASTSQAPLPPTSSAMFNLPSASGNVNYNNTSSAGFNSILSGMDLDLDPAVLAAAAATASDFPDLPPLPERQKSKKEIEQDKRDLELSQLLESMDEWKPVIPDEVTDFYLQRAGFETDDVRVKRLLALATQRFVSSIASDAFQYARARSSTSSKKDGGQTKSKNRARTVLTMEDLSAALKEYGVDASRSAYYL
ncbi:hypothetical protein OIV83_004030 [Microbotryomycetes sp. JL201]|nr:hypothetical protein OIV83_004030 [Microbotryomycetes sp. JL201]